jgi:hypothetical protein
MGRKPLENGRRRWRVRFRLWHLLALIALIALYFGSWPWVLPKAMRDIDSSSVELTGPGVVIDRPTSIPYVINVESGIEKSWRRDEYYLWIGFPWKIYSRTEVFGVGGMFGSSAASSIASEP